MTYLVRHRQGEPFTPRRFGPKTADAVFGACAACEVAFREGDETALVPIGPGADEESQAKAREGRWYNAVAVEAHYACVMGKAKTAE